MLISIHIVKQLVNKYKMSDYERLQEKAGHAFEEATKLLNDRSSWEEVSSDQNATVSKIMTEGGINALKVDCFYNGNCEASVNYAYSHWEEMELTLGDMMADMRVLQTFEDGSKLRIEKTKPMGPVSAREAYIYSCKQQLDENTYAILSTSSPLEHPLAEGFVRPEISFALQLFQPVGGDMSKTNLTVIELVDPKGNIPTVIINHVITDRVVFYTKLVEHLKSR
ncbi:unnamed protein product [Blepharisma stoltei]|uniref:START domain-containing protein n=1 Tax=Blepharisma stoltei TaxID=1481888 RepID=A0AAU9KI41_9CILI|nr:unnamed protein product [Blepharisma stoltei]